MGAPSSRPRLLHFVWEPRRQRMDALSTANVNLVRIHPITSPILFPHFTEILSPSFFKNTLASPPNIPSTEQHTGVKRALLSSQADEYFDFFPSLGCTKHILRSTASIWLGVLFEYNCDCKLFLIIFTGTSFFHLSSCKNAQCKNKIYWEKCIPLWWLCIKQCWWH